MRAMIPALLTISLLLPGAASGAGIKPWVGLNGSWGSYSMGDVNDLMADLNAGLKGTALHLWNVEAGPGVGLSAGLDLGHGFSLGVGYDRIFAASGVEDPSHYAQFRFPADGVKAIAEYALPTKGLFGARLGVAGGRVSASGSIVFPSGYDAVLSKVTGSGPLFETYLGADWLAQPRCVLTATVGYRSARIKEATVAQPAADQLELARVPLDYSGPIVRLGARIPLGAPPAAAGPNTAGTAKITPWVGAEGSWGTFFMTDVNRDLSDEIHSGTGMGASAGLDLSPRVGIGIGYERLLASRELPGGSPVTYDLPANAWRAFVEYRLPSANRLSGRLGIAGGAVMETGSVKSTTDRYKITGSGPLIEAYATAEWRAAPRLTVVVSECARVARVGEVKMEDVVLWNGDGARLSMDYSGVAMRLGVRVPLIP